MDPAAGTVPAGAVAVAVPMPPVETKAAHGDAGRAPAEAESGAVVVPVEVEAAAPAAGAGAGAAQPAPAGPARRWSWTRSWTLIRAREPWAKGLLLLGCAAAALAVVAMALPPADSSSRLHPMGACVPTDAEAASLPAASMELLLAASAQVLAATVALRVPATPVNLGGWLMGGQTAFLAVDVLGTLASCHGRLYNGLAVNYCIVYAMVCVLFLVGFPISFRRDQ
ncbi:hypothetical protein BS78_10G043700 [Paspalum vaginatum]|nr:hypothetical protein BS78_10G043700 [Paspalum vaginatum]